MPGCKQKVIATKPAALHCTANCKYSGKFDRGMLQCHLCQLWVHGDCVNIIIKDVVGIWSCDSCRTMPSVVAEVLNVVKTLEVAMSVMF